MPRGGQKWNKKKMEIKKMLTVKDGGDVAAFFLEPHSQQMEVPRLGVELEPQLPAYTTATATPGP